MNYWLIGAVATQGYIIGEFALDVKHEVDNPSIWSGPKILWEGAKAATATAVIWSPAAVMNLKGRAIVAGGAAILGSPIVVGTAAVATGYTVGAVVGTGIIYAATGGDESKTKMALDLYTNPRFEEGGILYEVADILGNAYRIAEHYEEAGYGSAGRGNPNHPDYQESGAVSAYREMYGY